MSREMSYSPEQLELDAALIADCGLPYGSYKDEVAAVYRAYAATLRQQAARVVRIDRSDALERAEEDAVLEGESCPHEAWEENGGWCKCTDCGAGWRAAAQPAERQGEAVEIEAVGRVERDMTGELGINWLLEGGLHAVGEGSVLLCADRNDLTDDEGCATVYTHPAAPVGVPDGAIDTRDHFGPPCVAVVFDTQENANKYRDKLTEAMQLRQNIAAAPSQRAEVKASEPEDAPGEPCPCCLSTECNGECCDDLNG